MGNSRWEFKKPVYHIHSQEHKEINAAMLSAFLVLIYLSLFLHSPGPKPGNGTVHHRLGLLTLVHNQDYFPSDIPMGQLDLDNSNKQNKARNKKIKNVVISITIFPVLALQSECQDSLKKQNRINKN